ncbi:MAG: energy transducer TonB [Roseivirga sp.]|nr:energy transducer TonB [Roseivirga sp.]
MKYIFTIAPCLLLIFACADPLREIENEMPLTATHTNQPEEEEQAGIVCYFGPFEFEAKFPGGIQAWKNHQKQYLKQPQGDCVEGKVFLAFRVKASGEITNIQVSRGISPEADQAAIDLLKASPKWIPGTRNGSPVDSNMGIMIRFGVNH